MFEFLSYLFDVRLALTSWKELWTFVKTLGYMFGVGILLAAGLAIWLQPATIVIVLMVIGGATINLMLALLHHNRQMRRNQRDYPARIIS